MQAPLIIPSTSGSVQVEILRTSWLRECAHLPAVQALTPATEARLLSVLQHMLADTGDINVDYQDVWEVLVGATSLQFGMATAEGPRRIEMVGQQLWNNSTVVGDIALPARRIVLAIQSGTAIELEMDELTQLLEYIMSQAGDQAEVVFGHGLNAVLGENIQVTMLVCRH